MLAFLSQLNDGRLSPQTMLVGHLKTSRNGAFQDELFSAISDLKLLASQLSCRATHVRLRTHFALGHAACSDTSIFL